MYGCWVYFKSPSRSTYRLEDVKPRANAWNGDGVTKMVLCLLCLVFALICGYLGQCLEVSSGISAYLGGDSLPASQSIFGVVWAAVVFVATVVANFFKVNGTSACCLIADTCLVVPHTHPTAPHIHALWLCYAYEHCCCLLVADRAVNCCPVVPRVPPPR